MVYEQIFEKNKSIDEKIMNFKDALGYLNYSEKMVLKKECLEFLKYGKSFKDDSFLSLVFNNNYFLHNDDFNKKRLVYLTLIILENDKNKWMILTASDFKNVKQF